MIIFKLPYNIVFKPIPKIWSQNFLVYLTRFFSKKILIKVETNNFEFVVTLKNTYFATPHTKKYVEIIILNYLISTDSLINFLPPNFIERREKNDIPFMIDIDISLPVVKDSVPGNYEVELNNYDFPFETIPNEFICPTSRSVMSIPVYFDTTPSQCFDLKSLLIQLWLKRKNPLTNEDCNKYQGYVVHTGLIHLIRVFLDKVKFFHLNKININENIQLILAKESYQLFIEKLTNQKQETLKITQEDTVQEGIKLIMTSGNYLLGLECLEPQLSKLDSQSDLLTMCCFALAFAHCLIQNSQEGRKYSRMFLSQLNESICSKSALKIIALSHLLVPAGGINIAIALLQRSKNIFKEGHFRNQSDILSKIEIRLSYLQYLKGLTALRQRKYHLHGFAAFLYKVQSKYKIRSFLRLKYLNKAILAKLQPEQINFVDKIICNDIDFAKLRENRILQALEGFSFESQGDSFFQTRNYDDAILAYDLALERNPDFSNLWHKKAITLQSDNKNLEAVYCYEKAIQYQPQLAILYYHKGFVLEAVGRVIDAIESYYHALDIDSNLSEVTARKTALLDKEHFVISALNVSFDRMIKIIDAGHKVEVSLLIKTFQCNPNLLNQITNERGISALYVLTVTEHGRTLLRDYNELRELITEEGLNSTCQNKKLMGMSPLFQLTLTTDGIELLAKDSTLRSKISSAGLSAATYCNETALFHLLLHLTGIQLFISDSSLRAKSSSETLNLAVTEGCYVGFTALMALVRHEIGVNILAVDRKLRDSILPVSLERTSAGINDIGLTPLLFMADKIAGRDILSSDINFRSKISARALNYVVPEGEFKGLSVLFLLLKKPDGIKILSEDVTLRDKIDTESLEKICEAKDFWEGVSPLFLLTSRLEGLNLLAEDKNLIKKISSKVLNYTCIEDNEFKGRSVLFNIAALKIELLLDNPDLFDKISSEGLESVSQNGYFKGASPLFFFTGTSIGRKLLTESSRLREKITSKGLNNILSEGANAGTSPIFFLLQYDSICEILYYDSILVSKIELASLLTVSKSVDSGLAPVLSLCDTPRGLRLLASSDKLRQIISKALNYVIPEGKYKNLSILFLLCRKIEGLKILAADKCLRDKIESESLGRVCIVDGFDEGISPLYIITSSSVGLNMLSEDDELRKKITSEMLNFICVNNSKFKGDSPLLHIAALKIELFLDNTQLLDKVTSEGLEFVSQSSFNKGKSPLFFFAGTEIGRKLLANNSSLRKKISSEGLNRIATEGSSEGTSPLFFLLQDDQGTDVLYKDPNLLQKVKSTCLSTVSKSVNKGSTPVCLLIGTDHGRKLLKLSSDLRRKISFHSLTFICETDRDKGFSPILYLLVNELHLLMMLINSNNNLFNEITSYSETKYPSLCIKFMQDVIWREGYSQDIKDKASQFIATCFGSEPNINVSNLSINS